MTAVPGSDGADRARPDSTDQHLSAARRVLSIESIAVSDLVNRLNDDFSRAVQRVMDSDGRLIVCGMGKSGLIGRKISATMASTGTRSFFMHPAEAFHGDLGMVAPDDVFLAISSSGETEEVVRLLPFLADNGNVLIAMTGNVGSTIARAAECHIDVAVAEEACPLQLAPTSSTTAALAMGDAFAVALMEARDFRPEQFAAFHPGGSLGRRLLSRVGDVMHTDGLPVIGDDESLIGVLSAITKSRLGVVVVRTDDAWGVITDGDVRRSLELDGEQILSRTARDLMTIDPVTVTPSLRTTDALSLMERKKISALLVLQDQQLVGVLTR